MSSNHTVEVNDQPHPRKGAQLRRPGRPAGRTLADGVIADRETLLAAAERLITKEGPAVSLDAIALEAGVTKPILYRGVGDRDSLVNALAERLNDRMASRTSQEVGRAQSPHDAIHRLVRGYLHHAHQERNIYLYVSGGSSAEDRIGDLLRLADMSTRQFADGIAAYRSARGKSTQVATTWSYGLLGALHYVTLRFLRQDNSDVDVVAHELTQMLWTGFSLESDPESDAAP